MDPRLLPTSDQFLASVERDAHLLAVAARKGLDAAVPSCPGWTVRKLVTHTGTIYRRKELVVTRGLTDRETEVEPPSGDLVDWFEESATLMLAAFRARGSGDHAWTWHGPDQTVGFWYRRMAHETLVHRVDAELAHGEVSEIDAVIANDGIDEALEIFIAGYPDWATLEKGQNIVKLTTPDRSWFLRTGSFSGTSKSGRVLSDVPTVLLETDVEDWDCEIAGSSPTLNLWLWGRAPLSGLDVSGDSELATYVRDVSAKST